MTATGADETHCRICGNELREGDDVVEIGDTFAHHDCAGAPVGSPVRKILKRAVLGARNQLGMGDTSGVVR
jgi:hypothetical protein